MRVLADENIDPDLVGWLRDQGHDVLSIREAARGAPDTRVLALAAAESRVLLTADKDFGELVFRQGLRALGIVLLRFHTRSRREFLNLFVSHWPDNVAVPPGNFVVATHQTLRVRKLRSET